MRPNNIHLTLTESEIYMDVLSETLQIIRGFKFRLNKIERISLIRVD